MPDAAIPKSVQEAVKHSPATMSGHVFSLYFPIWDRQWNKAGDAARLTGLQRVCSAPAGSLAQELTMRQKALARQVGAETIEAQNLSPFVTGMGEEHPVENGFAFLGPYGLPYLAGSGVKGVLRRAAEELAADLNPDGTAGWTHARVMWLFGYEEKVEYIEALDGELFADGETAREANDLLRLLDKDASTFTALSPDKTHFMGALAFWDVIIKGELGIDILTPHYGHYYQGDQPQPPHDAGQPVPNPFLVVAQEASFTFHITYPGEHRLPGSLQGDTWRELVRAAFNHAFEWGGFGAKTAVGYGVLETREAAKARQQEQERRDKEARARAKQEAEAERNRIRKGDRVSDQTGETGVVLEILDDIAKVDFYDFKDEIPLKELKKLP